jgi:hypothetical protein
MPMLAFVDMRVFFFTEAAWYSSMLVLSMFSVQRFGSLEGIGAAFVFTYLLLLLYSFRYVRRRLGFRASRSVITTWLSGLALLLLASAWTWNDVRVRWPSAYALILSAFALCWLSLVKTERRKALFALSWAKTE